MPEIYTIFYCTTYIFTSITDNHIKWLGQISLSTIHTWKNPGLKITTHQKLQQFRGKAGLKSCTPTTNPLLFPSQHVTSLSKFNENLTHPPLQANHPSTQVCLLLLNTPTLLVYRTVLALAYATLYSDTSPHCYTKDYHSKRVCFVSAPLNALTCNIPFHFCYSTVRKDLLTPILQKGKLMPMEAS